MAQTLDFSFSMLDQRRDSSKSFRTASRFYGSTKWWSGRTARFTLENSLIRNSTCSPAIIPIFPFFPASCSARRRFRPARSWSLQLAPPVDGGLPVVTRLNNVKFRRMVRPGETLDIHAELVERMSNAYFLKARTEVDGQTSCSLEFACTLTSKKAT